jgi:hypothetical protein
MVQTLALSQHSFWTLGPYVFHELIMHGEIWAYASGTEPVLRIDLELLPEPILKRVCMSERNICKAAVKSTFQDRD